MENICQFVPFHKDYHSIHTINFVLETMPQAYSPLLNQSVYKMHYVLEGDGAFHTAKGEQKLKKGDVFFTFPNIPFGIESKNKFKYMYISFLGTRGNMLLEKIGITNNNCFFEGYNDIENIWKSGITCSSDFSDIMSESVLLYTFARLSENLMPKNNKTKTETLSLHIKKYIDDNFANPKFSVEHMAKKLCYNKKYISFVFKKETDISLVEYLNTVRIQNAVALINQGFSSVCDIAHLSGFSDPQYFSKVFKKHICTTPTNYIKQQTKK